MKNRKPVPAVALIAGGAGDRELLSVRAAAMLDSASPLYPSVRTRSRSSSVRILLVA